MEPLRRLLTSVAIVFVAVLGAMGTVRAEAAPAPPLAAAAASDRFEFEPGEEAEWESEWDEGDAEAGWDEGEAADECEFDDEAREEACEEALEAKEEALEAREAEVAEARAEAEECRLESAEATVATVPARNQLRLTVRYTAFEPGAVSIDLALRGGRGALDLGADTARLGRAGTLHWTETLTEPQMRRALAAREFAVGVHALNTPGHCRAGFQRHLTARKDVGAGVRWSDPGAERRAKGARAARASDQPS